MIVIDAPLLLAVATLLTAISNIIWSMRRKR